MTSRYEKSRVLSRTDEHGRVRQYLEPRHIPPTPGQTLDLSLGPNRRPDQLAAEILGDPSLWWRICDASELLNPFDAGLARTLRVPLPGTWEEP